MLLSASIAHDAVVVAAAAATPCTAFTRAHATHARTLTQGQGQALAVEHGQIDGYHVVYDQAPHNWSAYSTDVPGVIATGKTRADVERVMREAIAFYFEDDDPAR